MPSWNCIILKNNSKIVDGKINKVIKLNIKKTLLLSLKLSKIDTQNLNKVVQKMDWRFIVYMYICWTL